MMKVGDTFIAHRMGGPSKGPRATREFTVLHITPSGWLRCESKALERPNGSRVKLREFATFTPDGPNYTTRRRSDTWAPYWSARPGEGSRG